MKEKELRAVCTLIWQTWPWNNSFEEAFLDFKKNIPFNAKNDTDRQGSLFLMENRLFLMQAFSHEKYSPSRGAFL
jgi:hypothetical protein